MNQKGDDTGIWAEWKYWTARFLSIPVARVDEAMDARSRRLVPWRYQVWSSAGIVALLAYVPIGVLIALISHFWIDFLPPLVLDVVLYGPILAIFVLTEYWMIRRHLGPPLPTTDWFDEAEMERRVVGFGKWRWLGPALLVAFVLGRGLLAVLR